MKGQYYANLLVQARDAVFQKRRGKLRRRILVLQDNAPVYWSHVARLTLIETEYV